MHSDRTRGADPNLHGLSIREFGVLCNLISESGRKDAPGYISSAGGKSQAFFHEIMGVPLRFEAKRDWSQNGYTLQYELGWQENRDWWCIRAWGSTFPPGNTDRSAGHYFEKAYDKIVFSYLRGQRRERYVFDFSLRGDDERYRHQMALIRLSL